MRSSPASSGDERQTALAGIGPTVIGKVAGAANEERTDYAELSGPAR
jgi:hypothetical protein